LEILEKVLGDIDGGCVLDVATQRGNFVRILREHLKSYTEIVGIDIGAQHIQTARSRVEGEGIRFAVMDAGHLDIEDGHFDTVTISASLHHLSEIPRVLGEMKRVLKPGGRFLIVEMHRDAQTEAAQSFVSLHEWVAQVDTALGRVHNRLLARQEFVDYAEDLGLSRMAYYDGHDLDSDPMEVKRIENLEGLIDEVMSDIEGISDGVQLKARGEELRHRLHTVGARDEPRILIVGVK
jgi:SAM-dependent methyltransferase